MFSIKALVKELGIFERNKVPLDLKILGLAFYIQMCSLRRVAKALSEFHKVSKTAIGKWVNKFKEKVNISPSKIPRRLIALDETGIKLNGKQYWVYAAIDIDRNEILVMKVYSTRNILVSRLFIKEVLKYCEGNPKFIIDNAPWLSQALEMLNLSYDIKPFR